MLYVYRFIFIVILLKILKYYFFSFKPQMQRDIGLVELCVIDGH